MSAGCVPVFMYALSIEIFPLLFAATKLFNWKSSTGNFISALSHKPPSVSSTKIQFKSNFPHMRAVCKIRTISIIKSSKADFLSVECTSKKEKKNERWRALISFHTVNLIWLSLSLPVVFSTDFRLFFLWFTDQQFKNTVAQCSLTFDARNVGKKRLWNVWKQKKGQHIRFGLLSPLCLMDRQMNRQVTCWRCVYMITWEMPLKHTHTHNLNRSCFRNGPCLCLTRN